MPELMQEHFMARETTLGGIKFSQMHQARTRADISAACGEGRADGEAHRGVPLDRGTWRRLSAYTLIVSEPDLANHRAGAPTLAR